MCWPFHWRLYQQQTLRVKTSIIWMGAETAGHLKVQQCNLQSGSIVFGTFVIRDIHLMCNSNLQMTSGDNALALKSSWFDVLNELICGCLTHLPLDAYMGRWTGSALFQIMACRLDGTKPLSKPMLTYCQLKPKEHISVKFYLKFKYFRLRKCVWTCRLPKWRPSCPS